MNSWPVSWQFTIVVGGQNVMGVCLDPTWLKHQANANDKNLLWSSCYWLVRAVQNRSEAELRPGARMFRPLKPQTTNICAKLQLHPQSGIRDRVFLGTCLCGTLLLLPLVEVFNCGRLLALSNIHILTCLPWLDLSNIHVLTCKPRWQLLTHMSLSAK